MQDGCCIRSLDGNQTSSREALVTQSSKGAIAIQKENWKLIMSSGSGGHWTKPFGEYPKLVDNKWENVQLYNLENDLKETNNIASQHQEKVNELANQLGQYIVDGRSRKGHTTKEDIELWEQVKWAEHLSLTKPKI